MQELIESLKSDDLSPIEKKELSAERTKLSLKDPEAFHDLFGKDIHKKISAIRLSYFDRERLIFDVTRKLCLSTVQTLIICGKHDVQCPLEYSIEMDELIPNSDVIIFQQSNHYPFLEEKKLFNQEIEKFFQKV